jgi:hypothetical protein
MKGPRLRLRALFRVLSTKEITVWKIAVGFIVFAAMAMFVIMQAGDKIDMGGEKHGAEAVQAPATGASAPK